MSWLIATMVLVLSVLACGEQFAQGYIWVNNLSERDTPPLLAPR